MKRVQWPVLLGIVLVLLSIALYVAHYFIFHDLHHIFIYMVGDIAFVPVEVLLVTLIIHKMMSQREKRNRLEKLNMVIGAFFSDVGTHLLASFSDADLKLDTIRENLLVDEHWSDATFSRTSSRLREHDYSVDIQRMDLFELHMFLRQKRDFLLRLLENPTLLEHESFTELLLAVFHLTEELESRDDVTQLPDTDTKHLSGDIKRVYVQIAYQWLDYMKYLKRNYPFLFSLAMRTNPFDRTASPIVT